jgi:hypothetical protein
VSGFGFVILVVGMILDYGLPVCINLAIAFYSYSANELCAPANLLVPPAPTLISFLGSTIFTVGFFIRLKPYPAGYSSKVVPFAISTVLFLAATLSLASLGPGSLFYSLAVILLFYGLGFNFALSGGDMVRVGPFVVSVSLFLVANKFLAYGLQIPPYQFINGLKVPFPNFPWTYSMFWLASGFLIFGGLLNLSARSGGNRQIVRPATSEHSAARLLVLGLIVNWFVADTFWAWMDDYGPRCIVINCKSFVDESFGSLIVLSAIAVVALILVVIGSWYLGSWLAVHSQIPAEKPISRDTRVHSTLAKA